MINTNQPDRNEYYKDRAVSFGIQWVEEEKRAREEAERAAAQYTLTLRNSFIADFDSNSNLISVTFGGMR